MPQWFLEMQTSDWLLFAFAIALLVFAFDYGGFTPWWKHGLGYIIFGYGLSMVMFTGLIIYGVIAGERAPEWVRVPVMFFALTMIIGKEIALKMLRRQGRIERRALRERAHGVSSASTPPLEGSLMDNPDVSLEEIKDVSTIWFKAQRVLRSVVGTLISALTVWAALVVVFPQMLAELATILPGPAIAWLTGVIAAISAAAGAISRIMAIPKVNAWLTKWLNLGSIPKQNISAKVSPVNGNIVVTVDPDRKAIKNG